MPLFGPDRVLVSKLKYCLTQIIDVPFSVDDRVEGYLLPLDAKLKPNVFVGKWSKTDNSNIFSGMVERGEPPTKKGDPYEWHLPGMVLGTVRFGWPSDPDDKALAYKVAEWLLILESRQKSDFEVKRGPMFASVPTVQFATTHNGFGTCVMGLIYDPI